MNQTRSFPFLSPAKNTYVKSAEGAYLYMDNGDKILDAAGGAIVSNIGHGRKDVAEAIYAATLNCTYAIPPWLTPEREALAIELTDHWLPEHLTRIHLSSSGSEGNESAIKIAVQYFAATGKPSKSRYRRAVHYGTARTY